MVCAPPRHPALREYLLTYLGNKRALLPFLWSGFRAAARRIGTVERFGDLFAGSGVVGRAARLAGLVVHSNDFEDYTRPFGDAFISPGHAPSAERYAAALDRINALSAPRDDRSRFLSRHYAPRCEHAPDADRERLFYTPDNAAKLDAMLEYVHALPPRDHGLRALLLAGILVQMSVRANTSGVMKGFHRGWGGRGGDAIARIMATVHLQPAPTIAGPVGCTTVATAADAAHGRRYDLVYADPPYNIHQYGANYHLLTSAVRWDGYGPGPVTVGARAGIRRDHQRSDFCRRAGVAQRAIEEFLEAVRTKALVLSYGTQGILSAELLLELLSDSGANTVDLLERERPQFRGGKGTQSAARAGELLFVVITGRHQPRGAVAKLKRRVRDLTELRALLDRHIDPWAWRTAGGSARHHAHGWTLDRGAGRVELDRYLSARRIDEPSAIDTAVVDATISKAQAIHLLAERGHVSEAVVMLKSLKVHKYHDQLRSIAASLLAQTVSEAQELAIRAALQRIGHAPISTSATPRARRRRTNAAQRR